MNEKLIAIIKLFPIKNFDINIKFFYIQYICQKFVIFSTIKVSFSIRPSMSVTMSVTNPFDISLEVSAPYY